MLSATIEASVFAPPGTPSAPSLYEYIARLLHWSEVLNRGVAQVLISRATQEILVTSNSFPLRPWLAEMLATAGVIEYDANTVAKLAETLLAKAEELEEKVEIKDLLFDSLTVQPNIFAQEPSSDLRWDAQRSAVILAIIGRVTQGPRSASHCLVVRPNPGVNRIRVHCLIPLIEHSRKDLGSLPLPPNFLDGETLVGGFMDECIMAVDEAHVLQRAVSTHDVVDAIKVALYKHRATAGLAPTCFSLPNFKINAHFLDCMQHCGVFTSLALARKTMRSIVDAVEELSLPSVHALRTGSGANDPQVYRNGVDVAWRRDIDYEYHLHYWQCVGGIKELACMVHHNDFHICE